MAMPPPSTRRRAPLLGNPVDRCLVLVDDTISREHAYTALSRGRHGNDLYVVAEDRRAEERHATEVDADPLDAVRRAIGRTAGKHLAVDNVNQGARLEQLRRERDALQRRGGDGPPDPTRENRQLTEAVARETRGRDGAQWRLESARRSLRELGPVGRRTHRAERRELERRIARFQNDIARHDTIWPTLTPDSLT